MLDVVTKWYKKYFSHPEAVLLLVLLIVGFGLIILAGDILAPVLASIVIAYLLQGWHNFLIRKKVPHSLSYTIVYVGFLALFIVAILVLLPLLWRQVINLFTELPTMMQNAKAALTDLAIKYPAYFSTQQIDTLISSLITDVQSWAKTVVSGSFAYIPGVIAWVVYLVLVPVLVFFFLKDAQKITGWFSARLPKDRQVLQTVCLEMDRQIGNYIRGKITEIIIVGVATYAVFLLFGLKYAALLATLVGLSVIIPYIGAVVVTIPVILVGYLQWGLDSTFAYMFIVYLIVQALDGNVLVPILFSEAVNLHPTVIIVSILIFGALWGFWGVFFAIPLATLCKTVFYAWPTNNI